MAVDRAIRSIDMKGSEGSLLHTLFFKNTVFLKKRVCSNEPKSAWPTGQNRSIDMFIYAQKGLPNRASEKMTQMEYKWEHGSAGFRD